MQVTCKTDEMVRRAEEDKQKRFIGVLIKSNNGKEMKANGLRRVTRGPQLTWGPPTQLPIHSRAIKLEQLQLTKT